MATPETLTLHAHDGGSFAAHVERPDSAGPHPAVVVIQEIFGVNAVVRQACAELAAAGYVAIAPDLFWRQQPGVQLTDRTQAEWDQAFALMNGFDQALGVRDLASTLSAARTLPGTTGRVAAQGYCLGGRMAILAALETDADACVSYYGVGLGQLAPRLGPNTRPLLMHIAERDRFVPAEEQQAMVAAAAHLDQVEVHLYPNVDHAFARPGGEHFDNDAAILANRRSAEFLAQHLKPL